ncbi:response regulator [Tenacibaculum amylolyticum]|uniref:response regulator n=1 Tax=Tenacibaculum amylolyticum TaxID=104269 RepID=UPI00389453E0
MFKKILIAEDKDHESNGVVKALEESLENTKLDYAQYCDEAFLKFKKALQINEPFDLVISDLSFVDNPHQQRLHTGEDLITAIKELQPDLKTIMFSIEDRAYRVKQLCNDLDLNGYVWKSTNALKDLKKAIKEITYGNFFISPQLSHALRTKEPFEVTSYDVFILQQLAEGLDQKEISEALKKEAIKPASISSVEKRLKLLKENFNANNPTQLIAITKDFGLI